ncbi:MAG: hypothetical protein WAZ21_03630 [Candidatus Saccharimonadales bacterium]
MGNNLNTIGRELKDRLVSVERSASEKDKQLINVANVGRIVATAYEQLRNSAEYTQEHLLRQRAIRRFLVRNVSFRSRGTLDRNLAEEIIVELTQAGYIENDTIPHSSLAKISQSLSKHYENYWRMEPYTTRAGAEELTLDLISVEVEAIIADDKKLQIYQYFAYQHYRSVIDEEKYKAADSKESYDACLYIAVHKTLLKSDLPTVRYDLQQLYQFSDDDMQAYVHFHNNITESFSSDLTNKLSRLVDRHGAPLRIFRSMVEERENLSELLGKSGQFVSAYQSFVEAEYKKASKRLNKALVKSILFLLITKSLLGILIEIPYDLAVTGSIIILPLVINLLAPIVYLLIQRVSIKVPGKVNTETMVVYMSDALYGDETKKISSKHRSTKYSVAFSIVYAAMFIFAFGLVLNRLISLEFNLVQIVLFTIFLATASFLGFRLTGIIRELELVTAKVGVVQLIRDFLYMPFIVLGRWLSEEYKKINIVALILDTVIELPLKTVLRLVRQWTTFLNDKKDEL